MFQVIVRKFFFSNFSTETYVVGTHSEEPS